MLPVDYKRLRRTAAGVFNHPLTNDARYETVCLYSMPFSTCVITGPTVIINNAVCNTHHKRSPRLLLGDDRGL